MSHVESIYGARPKDKKLPDAGAKSRGTFATPMRMPSARRLKLERLSLPVARTSPENRFVRVIENRETSCFEGEFSFKLTGVVLNGRFPGFAETFVKGKGTAGDRLMSRLLPLLHRSANIRFTFGGGGEANFEWMIQGITRAAKSKAAAVSAALTLRRDLQMILLNEPCFRFAPERIVAAQAAEPAGGCWQAVVAPSGISLPIS